MEAHLNRLTIYTRKMAEVEAFYTRFFGYTALHDPEDRLVELRPPGGGAVISLHPLAKGRKSGQTLVKLAFDVEDVPAFCAWAKANGLAFGSIHQADGYQYANAKDPAGNNISITSRSYRDGDPR